MTAPKVKWPPFVQIVDGFPVINIGALRHTVTLLAYGPTSPPTFNAGGPVLQYAPFLTEERAAIETVRGTDMIKGGQVTTQLFLVVAMYFVDGILPNMRVQRHNGTTYEIQSIENILEMDRVLLLNCLGLAGAT